MRRRRRRRRRERSRFSKTSVEREFVFDYKGKQ